MESIQGYDWKGTDEHGVVADLCIPDCFILVVTSYHSFYFETRGHCSTCAWGVWFKPDLTTIFYYESLQIRESKKIYPLPPENYPLYGMTH